MWPRTGISRCFTYLYGRISMQKWVLNSCRLRIMKTVGYDNIVDIYRYLWFYMLDICWYVWLLLDIYGYLWFYTWISIVGFTDSGAQRNVKWSTEECQAFHCSKQHSVAGQESGRPERIWTKLSSIPFRFNWFIKNLFLDLGPPIPMKLWIS